MIEVVVSTDPPGELLGKQNAERLISEVCKPEVAKFEKWFREQGNSGLMAMERDLLAAYLFQKLNGTF